MWVIVLCKRIVAFIFAFIFAFPSTVYAQGISISADNAVVYDKISSAVLYQKNSDKRVAMASTTKIMTCLIACEKLNADDVVIISDNMLKGTEGSLIYLKAGDKISVYDLIKGAMLASGNDAANALAEHVGGATRISIIYNIPEISVTQMPYDMDENTIYKDTANNKYYFKHNNSVEELTIEDSLPTANESTLNKFYYSKTDMWICKGVKYKGFFSKEYRYYWNPIAYNVKFNPSTDIIITNNYSGENIIIDGANKIISTSTSRIVGDDFSWNWLALRRGEKTIEVTGNCEISFEWRDPIKIGQF